MEKLKLIKQIRKELGNAYLKLGREMNEADKLLNKIEKEMEKETLSK